MNNCKQCAVLSLNFQRGNFTLCFKKHIYPKDKECYQKWLQQEEFEK